MRHNSAISRLARLIIIILAPFVLLDARLLFPLLPHRFSNDFSSFFSRCFPSSPAVSLFRSLVRPAAPERHKFQAGLLSTLLLTTLLLFLFPFLFLFLFLFLLDPFPPPPLLAPLSLSLYSRSFSPLLVHCFRFALVSSVSCAYGGTERRDNAEETRGM